MTEEDIAQINHRLDVLHLCVQMADIPPEDADILKKAQAKLQEAKQTRKDIDDLIRRYDELKAEEAGLVAQLELRLRLAELQKAFLDGLPPSTPKSASNGAQAGLDTAGKVSSSSGVVPAPEF